MIFMKKSIRCISNFTKYVSLLIYMQANNNKKEEETNNVSIYEQSFGVC